MVPRNETVQLRNWNEPTFTHMGPRQEDTSTPTRVIGRGASAILPAFKGSTGLVDVSSANLPYSAVTEPLPVAPVPSMATAAISPVPVPSIASNAATAATLPGRFFHVDFIREPNTRLGINVQECDDGGLKLCSLDLQGCIGTWNSRSAVVFPEGQLQIGDIIVRVNGAGTAEEMMRHLKDTKEFSWWSIVICEKP